MTQRHATRTTWIEAVQGHGLDVIAGALGLEPLRGAGRLTPCPGCGAATTSKRDKRGPVGLRSDRLGWTCHACKAGGDLIALVAVHLFGDRLASGDDRWRELRAWCAAQGWCDPPRGDVRPPAPRRPVAADTRHKLAEAAREDDRPPMPRELVEAAWERFTPVTEDAEVRAYLEGRKLDPDLIAGMDLARAIPAGATCPTWATIKGRPWTAAGYRLAVRMFDADGRPALIHARNVLPSPPEGCPKTASPAGYGVRGLVMANRIARTALLEHEPGERDPVRGLPAPTWLRAGELLDVVVAEGLTDWLAWAAAREEQDEPAAVLGIVSGSLQPEHARLLPKGRARLLIATDHDEAGDRYAETARETLGRNAARIIRWTPTT